MSPSKCVIVLTQDNEYVIYDTSQQRLRYLVEFSLPDDKVSPVISQSKEEEEEEPGSQEHSAKITEIGKCEIPASSTSTFSVIVGDQVILSVIVL